MLVNIDKIRLKTDFNYRIIREDGESTDVFLEINYRTVNIYDPSAELFDSRIQFPYVRAIILRIASNSHRITVHLLRDIDMFSAFANFEVNCENSILEIINSLEKVNISKKKISVV